MINPSTVIPLEEKHRLQLVDGSGISQDVVDERNYISVLAHEVKAFGFASSQKLDGLLIPIFGTDGKNGLYVLRPDNPRLSPEGKELKYEIPKGQGVRLDCPRRCQPMLADPTIDLWVTEGPKKADALASRGKCVIDLLGVWNFKGKNDSGGTTFLADWDYVALNSRKVHLVFDSDLLTKTSVRQALERLAEHLQRKGALVDIIYLPPLPSGKKCGVDDYLLTHSIGELEALIQAPKPDVKAAPPQVELLDIAPPVMSRPLQLIDGRSYAAVWAWTRTTRTETVDKKGDIVRLQDPQVTTERRLFVLRNDGVLFGEGGDKPMEESGLQVNLPSPPRDAKLLSVAGVKAYRVGGRPDPKDVYMRLVRVIDRFISFDRSIGTQGQMCRFLACYALSTWFIEAMSTAGYLWPNGGYGTGKTKTGVLVCELAYLGEVLLSGSTYATLRDLADMGATLMFDDAENLSDPRRTDPDKRNLLLASNRRGATITVKEPAPDGTWKTRNVNAFGPKIFTAIRLPDAVLGSRSVVVPLVRTPDANKANAEPLDYKLWPCDQRKLLDDLWASGLANLPSIYAHEASVNTDAPLVGRNLEPWRPVLTVAHWLESLGEIGLYQEMVDLAQGYQTERIDLETTDLTRLLVRGLLEIVPSAPFVPSVPFEFSVSELVNKINELAIDDDIVDGNDPPYTNSKRVGKVLTTLRVRQMPRSGGKGSRKRMLTMSELDSIARSYGFNSINIQHGTPIFETAHMAHTDQTAQEAPKKGYYTLGCERYYPDCAKCQDNGKCEGTTA